MNNVQHTQPPVPGTAPAAKKTYRPPALTLFGHVAALTQGDVCSAANDGAGSCPSAGGSGMGMIGSDRRLKRDILRVGDHAAGFGLYLFRYKAACADRWGWGRQFGVMADEVQKVMPRAVTTGADGYKLVDYTMLGIRDRLH